MLGMVVVSALVGIDGNDEKVGTGSRIRAVGFGRVFHHENVPVRHVERRIRCFVGVPQHENPCSVSETATEIGISTGLRHVLIKSADLDHRLVLAVGVALVLHGVFSKEIKKWLSVLTSKVFNLFNPL